jgi:hypothetical protein
MVSITDVYETVEVSGISGSGLLLWDIGFSCCHYIVIYVASLVLPHFSTLSHKWHNFQKKVLNINVRFDILHNFCLKHSHFKTNHQDIIHEQTSSCNVLVILVSINKIWIFSRDLRKILKHQISWKSASWKLSCSMWTAICDEANSHFSQFCKCA